MPRRRSSDVGAASAIRRELVTWPADGIVPNGGIDDSVEPIELEPSQWTEGLDVEPIPNGVRRRLGLEYVSDSIGTNIQTNATGSDDYDPLNSTTFGIAQRFTTGGANEILEGVTVNLKLSTQPALPFPLLCRIVPDDGGQPDMDALSGFDVGNFNQISTEEIGTGFTAVQFNLFTPTTIVTAADYWVVITLPTITSGFDVIAQCLASGGANPTAYTTGVIESDPWAWTATAAKELVHDIRRSASEKEITAIHDLQLDNGTQRHIVAFTQTVYKNTAGVLASLGQFDTAHTKDDHPSLITVDNRLAATNGADGDPSKTYYENGGSGYWQNEGISKPTGNLTLVRQLTGGALPDGTYYVDVFFINDEAPREIRSNPRYEGDSSAAATAVIALGGGTGSIDVTGHPTAVARTNDRANRKAFYILGPGTAGQWRRAVISGGLTYSDIATGGTITLTDTTDESAEFDHDVPPTHSIKLSTSKRQYIAGIEDHPRRIMWSRKRGYDVDVESFPAFDRHDMGADNDKVQGMAFVPPSIVLVGMRDSLWAIDDNNPDGEPTRIADVGFAGKNAVSVVNGQSYFWSNARKHKGPYFFDGQRVQRLKKLDQFVNGVDGVGGLNRSRFDLISCAIYEPDRSRYQWWSLVSQAGEVGHNRVIVWDYALNSPTIYRITGNILGLVEESGTDRVMIGTVAGREVKADSGNTDLGETIEGSMTLRPYTFGDIHDRQKIRGIVTASKSTNLGDLLLRIATDLGEGQEITVSLSQAGNAGSILGTGSLGAFVLAGAASLFRKQSFRVSGRVFTPTFSGTSNWELNRLAWLVLRSDRK